MYACYRGYDKIGKATGVAKSTVRGIIKRGDRHGGDVRDALRSGGPTKITDAKRKRVESILDEDPRLPLREITSRANIGLGHSTVDKIISETTFRLLVPRKKPFWRKGQKEKRKDFCFRRRRWAKSAWWKVVFVDECTIEYDPCPAGKKVRVRRGEELSEKNLKPSFKSGRTSISVFACITKGSRSELVLVRKRKAKERTSPRDRLGLNAHQYATEIHKPVVIPFILAQGKSPDHIYLGADGAKWHYGGENKSLCEEVGYLQLPWPPNSPDLNPIENVWMLLKRQLRKRFSLIEQRPHSEADLFSAAQEEWALIAQDVIDSLVNSMPERLQAVLDADGGHTKW